MNTEKRHPKSPKSTNLRTVTEVVDILGELIKRFPHDSTYVYKKRAYENVINKLKSIPESEILNEKNLNTITVSPHMHTKLLDIANRKINIIRKEDIPGWILEIGGIGERSAEKLVKLGVKTKTDLKLPQIRKHLTAEMITFITYMPIKQIPRTTINRFNSKLKSLNVKKQIDYVICGSYRRNSAFSGDIDILVIGNSNDFSNFIKLLKDNFECHIYANGVYKVSMIVKLGKLYVIVDVFYSTPDEYIYQLLYLTGSKNFNIQMRRTAKIRGFLLNQHGLYKKGKKVDVNDENDVFDAIGMTYVPPEQR